MRPLPSWNIVKLFRTWLVGAITGNFMMKISVSWGRPIIQPSPGIGFITNSGLSHTKLTRPSHSNPCLQGGHRARLIPPLKATVSGSISDVNVPWGAATNTYAVSVRGLILFPNVIFVAQPKHPVPTNCQQEHSSIHQSRYCFSGVTNFTFCKEKGCKAC